MKKYLLIAGACLVVCCTAGAAHDKEVHHPKKTKSMVVSKTAISALLAAGCVHELYNVVVTAYINENKRYRMNPLSHLITDSRNHPVLKKDILTSAALAYLSYKLGIYAVNSFNTLRTSED